MPVLLLRLGALFGLSLAWSLATAVGWSALFAVSPSVFPGVDLSAPATWSGAWLAAANTTQWAGVAAAATLCASAPRWPGASFGLRRASARSAAAAFMGAAVGWLGVAWFSSWMADLTGWTSDGTAQIARALRGGSTLDRVTLAASVAIAAPIFEEWVFRGALWKVLGEAVPPTAVWLGTSLTFSAMHGDRLSFLALLPAALWFGALRLRTGSLWPSMLGHATYNAALVGVAWWSPAADPFSVSFAAGAFGLAALAVTAALSMPLRGAYA